jgi:hypothetical protein
LREADPALRSSGVSSSAGKPGAGAAAASSTGSAPPMGAEMTPLQRAVLDRYVKSVGTTTLVRDVPGNAPEGSNFFWNEWETPGKVFIGHFIHDRAGSSESRLQVRQDGLITLASPADTQRALDYVARVEPSGKVIADWKSNGVAYHRETVEVANSPGTFTVVNYQNVAKPGRAPRWVELYREYAFPGTPQHVADSVARIKKQAEMKSHPFGALSLLPGTLWYCVGYEPSQWLVRRRVYQGEIGLLDESAPVMRLTVATWREPGRTLEVITKLGDGRGWTDVIGLQPDGSFAMTTTGVGAHANLVGRKHKSGAVTFPIARVNSHVGVLLNTIEFSTQPQDLLAPRTRLLVDPVKEDPASCDMKPFDKEKLPEWTKQLAEEQRYIGQTVQDNLRARRQFAADHAAGQQMLAGMQADLIGAVLGGGGSGPVAYSPQSTRTLDGQSASPFLQDLRNMADIAQRDAERSRQDLQAAIARGGSKAPASATAASAPAAPATKVASTSIGSKPLKMYGWCYADEHGGGETVYSSQIGSTDSYDPTRTNWQNDMEAEFKTRIGAHTALACYANPDPGFTYVRKQLYDNAKRVVEVPWAPH